MAASSGSTQLAASPAFYPRVALLPNGTAVASVATPLANGGKAISLCVRQTVEGGNETWVSGGVIVQDLNATADPDLDNGFLFATATTLLCAYRHHTGVGSARVYRIQVSQCVLATGCTTWSLLSTVSAGPTGVWEPFLFAARGQLHVVYSAELTNGGEQDVVQQDSTDGGATWSAVSARVHTAGSRNGMPGVAALPDGSLVMVMEGFWSGLWGHFTVNSVRSYDQATTWTDPVIVHAPSISSGANAGSPQVGVVPALAGSPGLAAVCAVYMSSEPTPPAGIAWPAGAHIASQCLPLNASQPAATLDWASATVRIVNTSSATAFWPSVFLDTTAHPAALLRVAYQTDSGAAMLTNFGDLP